jgi:predicted ester cyclase
MTTLAEQRIAVVRAHMEAENRRDFGATLETFEHPRYELFGAGQVFDGPEAVMKYFTNSRRAFPDQGNEPIALRAMDDAVLAEFWLVGTHQGPLQTAQGELAPTGKRFRVRMAAVFEFAPGGTGIVCERVYFDSASIIRQLTNGP